MNKNLHAYRNLGVPCLTLNCSDCGRLTSFSAYFEIGASRQKSCSLGCCDCGRGVPVSEPIYEELYELSFEYDRWQSGQISEETFRSLIPDSCKDLLGDFSVDAVCSKCGDESSEPATRPSVPASSGDARGRAELPTVVLQNRISAPLGTGLFMAALSGAVFFGVSFFMEFPSWAVGGKLVAVYGLVMGGGLVAGVAMSYKRFPKEVRIDPECIQILGRGRDLTASYRFRDVSRVNFGEGAKYLTFWLSDGKTYVVQTRSSDVEALNRYFGKSS